MAEVKGPAMYQQLPVLALKLCIDNVEACLSFVSEHSEDTVSASSHWNADGQEVPSLMLCDSEYDSEDNWSDGSTYFRHVHLGDYLVYDSDKNFVVVPGYMFDGTYRKVP